MSEFSVTNNAPSPAPAPAAEENTNTEVVLDGKESIDDLPREVQFPGSVNSQVPSLAATSAAAGFNIGGGPIFPGISDGHPPPAISKPIIPDITVINPTPESSQDQLALPGPPVLLSLPWLCLDKSTSSGHTLQSHMPAPPPALSKRKAEDKDARGRSSKPTSKSLHR
ncbi:hypothetical protein DXG01_006976 [Tephrocybe rancida]|nr:hypothetical protein DXG01_006976 [Tephrocybe rancida]